MAGPIPPRNGGTGVNNGTNTTTVTGGNVEFKVPADSSYTFPSSRPMIGIKDSGVGVVLSSGIATVNTALVATGDRIILLPTSIGGTPGVARISAIVNGTSFTITSSSALDNSTYSWINIGQ